MAAMFDAHQVQSLRRSARIFQEISGLTGVSVSEICKRLLRGGNGHNNGNGHKSVASQPKSEKSEKKEELNRKRWQRWTSEEVDYIKKHAGEWSPAQIALALRRTRQGVINTAFKNGISLGRQNGNGPWHSQSVSKVMGSRKRWTPEAIAYLKKHGRKREAAKIAMVLGRTLSGVYRAASRHKVSLKK